MSVTAETSHADRSWLKECALKNILFMLITADTSHDPIGPCGPVVQLPRGDSLRHASTARLSSILFCGENARVEAGGRERCVFAFGRDNGRAG